MVPGSSAIARWHRLRSTQSAHHSLWTRTLANYCAFGTKTDAGFYLLLSLSLSPCSSIPHPMRRSIGPNAQTYPSLFREHMRKYCTASIELTTGIFITCKRVRATLGHSLPPTKRAFKAIPSINQQLSFDNKRPRHSFQEPATRRRVISLAPGMCLR